MNLSRQSAKEENMNFFQLLIKRIKDNMPSYILFSFVFLLMYTVYGQAGLTPVKITLGLFVLGILLMTFKPKKIEYATFIIIMATGLASASLSPINDIPDESAHYQRSLFLSEGDMNLSNNPDNLLESEDYVQIENENRVPLMQSKLNNVQPSKKEISNARLTVTNAYYIFGYIPQAIGLKIGNMLNISIAFSYFLGRLFNVIFYAVIVFFAIKLSGRLSQVISVSSLLPMNIYLTGSYNQDALGTALILLTLALFIHFYQASSKVSLWKLALFVLLSCLLATIKLPFILLIFLIVFIPQDKFNAKSKSVWIAKVAGVISVLLLTVFWLKSYSEITNVNYLSVDYLENVDAKGQIISILSHPIIYGKVLLREFFFRLLNPANINLFGWLAYGPTFLITYNILFLMMVVLNNANKVTLNILSKLSLFLVTIGLYAGIILAMYVTWTPVGAQGVEGVQDRYVLGILPALLILLATNNKYFEKFQDFLDESLVLNISICLIYTMLLSTVFTYYNF